MPQALRIFFAAGPGNLIEAHQNWRAGVDDPSQMSVTFSAEFADYCEATGSQAYIVAERSPARLVRDGAFTLDHCPKLIANGVLFHVAEIWYGFQLVWRALRFRATHAVIQSGATHYFMLFLFRLFRIEVVPVLHNTLWPAGFPPRSLSQRLIRLFNGAFFRFGARSTICVSPECGRQIKQLTRSQHTPIVEMRPQFRREQFPIAPVPSANFPFRLFFAGRIIAEKGVFDLLEIMKHLEHEAPGAVVLKICGDGPALEQLRMLKDELKLHGCVEILGRVEPNALRQLIVESHAAVVPTRSEFAEGLAMTAIEPVLLGRPVVTSAVVPAFEILNGACIVAQTNDVKSYAKQILMIVRAPELYQRYAAACSHVREDLLSDRRSFKLALERVIG